MEVVLYPFRAFSRGRYYQQRASPLADIFRPFRAFHFLTNLINRPLFFRLCHGLILRFHNIHFINEPPCPTKLINNEQCITYIY